MMSDHLDPDVLDRYLSGRSLPGEADAVARWLETARLRGAPAFDTDAMLARVNARIDRAGAGRPAHAEPFGALPGLGARTWWRRLAAAAVVALAIGGSTLWWWERRAARDAAATAAPTVLATARGERRLVRLGDGSEVLLAPASRLTISPTYGREQRTVSLEGEAMFTVRHDAERPFRVRTAQAFIEDIGTEFGVRAYPADESQQVVVASGSVLFRTDRSPATVLERNQMARLTQDGAVQVRRDVDAGALLGWTRGELVFEDAPLERVVAELGRWYDVEIRLGDDRARAQRLTATLRTTSLEQALAVVTQSLDLKAQRTARAGGSSGFLLTSRP